MTSNLKPQLQNVAELKAVFREVPASFTLNNGKEVSSLLVYLHSDDDAPHERLFETIRQGLLYNFVFSCSEIQKKLGLSTPNPAEELFNKALKKLSKHTAKGELGELILFTLLDVYFKAPKILSKVSMKMTPRMPVFGADAVHAKFVGEELRLYLGEAKLYKKFSEASAKAATSMKTTIESYGEEFLLLDSYIDFPDLNPELETKLLTALNPFEGNDLSDVIHSPCFIGFSAAALIADAESECDFIEKYIELAKKHVQSFFDKVEAKNLSADRVSLLILPFNCVDELVDGFINYVGIEN